MKQCKCGKAVPARTLSAIACEKGTVEPEFICDTCSFFRLLHVLRLRAKEVRCASRPDIAAAGFRPYT